MIGTLVNTGTILAGSLIGGLFKKIMSERVNRTLFIAMGLAAFGLGINTVVQNMPNSQFPVLFIISLALGGAIGTLLHLRFVCRRVYPGYYYEGLVSMFGMMTGTISSGVLLLRELDPQMKTPAGNNLVLGSSCAILLAVPLLILVGMAPKSTMFAFLTLGCLIVYYFILLAIALSGKKSK